MVKKVNVIDTSGLVKKTNYGAEIRDVEDKIPSITALDTTAALTAAENKIPKFSDLVRKADYVAKISDIEKKYFINSHYNKFTNDILDAEIKKTEN